MDTLYVNSEVILTIFIMVEIGNLYAKLWRYFHGFDNGRVGNLYVNLRSLTI